MPGSDLIWRLHLIETNLARSWVVRIPLIAQWCFHQHQTQQGVDLCNEEIVVASSFRWHHLFEAWISISASALNRKSTRKTSSWSTDSVNSRAALTNLRWTRGTSINKDCLCLWAEIRTCHLPFTSLIGRQRWSGAAQKSQTCLKVRKMAHSKTLIWWRTARWPWWSLKSWTCQQERVDSLSQPKSAVSSMTVRETGVRGLQPIETNASLRQNCQRKLSDRLTKSSRISQWGMPYRQEWQNCQVNL